MKSGWSAFSEVALNGNLRNVKEASGKMVQAGWSTLRSRETTRVATEE